MTLFVIDMLTCFEEHIPQTYDDVVGCVYISRPNIRRQAQDDRGAMGGLDGQTL